MRKPLFAALVLSFIFAVFAPFSMMGAKNKALAALTGGPFGGQIKIIDRVCKGGIMFTLGPPTPGTYFYPYSAITYPYGPPNKEGKWTLGLANRGGVCVAGKKTYPTQYTVIMIGTSL